MSAGPGYLFPEIAAPDLNEFNREVFMEQLVTSVLAKVKGEGPHLAAIMNKIAELSVDHNGILMMVALYTQLSLIRRQLRQIPVSEEIEEACRLAANDLADHVLRR